jgi:hypothetical protein
VVKVKITAVVRSFVTLGGMKELTELADTIKDKLGLQYNAESIQLLEDIIENNKGAFPEDERSGWINSIGAFLGQCIIENYGGYWDIDEESGLITVAFDEKNKVYPFSKVQKLVDYGMAEDSISSMFNLLPKVFDLPES